jgi:uncharacterized protein YuzE
MTADVHIEASYLVVRPHTFSLRQLQIGPGTILDLDEDGRVLGVETIGDVPLATVLAQVLDRARFPKPA